MGEGEGGGSEDYNRYNVTGWSNYDFIVYFVRQELLNRNRLRNKN